MMGKIILILLLSFLLIGSELQETGFTEEELTNFTQSSFKYENFSQTIQQQANNQSKATIGRAIYKYADVLLFVAIEGGREAVIYGYDHPQLNYTFAFRLLILGLFAPLIIPIFFTIITIGYLISLGIKFIRKKYKK